ncbi:unnamed protein product [Spirodela intermedia]|uniref:Bet v I/Major latex protein domain-containing protein n=1 Tax=Spirodela intermedia TaxID=51605 RepID=A0A7I8JG60_SPIIN|nr:unnamed protein product [Spirodela intermedia]CAA6669126.1 unnamed protein product [Spirodela intermedia]
MVAGSFTQEIESPIAPARLWKAGILDADVLLPKLLPEVIASVDIIEGDGGVGTIKQCNFTPAVPDQKFVKDRTDVLDGENFVFKYTVVDGGFLGSRISSYSFEFSFTVSGAGSKGKLTLSYETADETPLSEEEVGKIIFGSDAMIKALEGYLLANPDAYV